MSRQFSVADSSEEGTAILVSEVTDDIERELQRRIRATEERSMSSDQAPLPYVVNKPRSNKPVATKESQRQPCYRSPKMPHNDLPGYQRHAVPYQCSPRTVQDDSDVDVSLPHQRYTPPRTSEGTKNQKRVLPQQRTSRVTQYDSDEHFSLPHQGSRTRRKSESACDHKVYAPSKCRPTVESDFSDRELILPYKPCRSPSQPESARGEQFPIPHHGDQTLSTPGQRTPGRSGNVVSRSRIPRRSDSQKYVVVPRYRSKSPEIPPDNTEDLISPQRTPRRSGSVSVVSHKRVSKPQEDSDTDINYGTPKKSGNVSVVTDKQVLKAQEDSDADYSYQSKTMTLPGRGAYYQSPRRSESPSLVSGRRSRIPRPQEERDHELSLQQGARSGSANVVSRRPSEISKPLEETDNDVSSSLPISRIPRRSGSYVATSRRRSTTLDTTQDESELEYNVIRTRSNSPRTPQSDTHQLPSKSIPEKAVFPSSIRPRTPMFSKISRPLIHQRPLSPETTEEDLTILSDCKPEKVVFPSSIRPTTPMFSKISGPLIQQRPLSPETMEEDLTILSDCKPEKVVFPSSIRPTTPMFSKISGPLIQQRPLSPETTEEDLTILSDCPKEPEQAQDVSEQISLEPQEGEIEKVEPPGMRPPFSTFFRLPIRSEDNEQKFILSDKRFTEPAKVPGAVRRLQSTLVPGRTVGSPGIMAPPHTFFAIPKRPEESDQQFILSSRGLEPPLIEPPKSIGDPRFRRSVAAGSVISSASILVLDASGTQKVERVPNDDHKLITHWERGDSPLKIVSQPSPHTESTNNTREPQAAPRFKKPLKLTESALYIPPFEQKLKEYRKQQHEANIKMAAANVKLATSKFRVTRPVPVCVTLAPTPAPIPVRRFWSTFGIFFVMFSIFILVIGLLWFYKPNPAAIKSALKKFWTVYVTRAPAQLSLFDRLCRPVFRLYMAIFAPIVKCLVTIFHNLFH